MTYKAALAGIKVIKIFENWTSQTCRSVTNEEQEGRRDCLCAKLVVKRMLIEMLLLISLTGLGYISKVGIPVNIPITLASTDRSTMMTRETRKRLPVYDR